MRIYEPTGHEVDGYEIEVCWRFDARGYRTKRIEDKVGHRPNAAGRQPRLEMQSWSPIGLRALG